VTVKGESLRRKAMPKEGPPLSDMHVKFSPCFPVNIDNETRQLAMIPGRAFSFVFCYGTAGDALEGATSMNKDVITFFRNGGFVYFDLNFDVVGVNMIQDPGIPCKHMIHFGPGTVLDPRAAAKMRARHTQHYHEVTLSFMREKGATHFAWIPPGDTFGSSVHNTLGGFAYLFADACVCGHMDRIFPIIPC
jgi:hypothetical protein